MMGEEIEKKAARRTKMALFWSSMLHEPLSTLYPFVAFILYKDLHATPFQIALLTMLKPLVTLLSFYWSAGSSGRLRANVLGAGLLMRLPFLFVPWFDSVWFVIAASVNYMLFYRAGVPAWMEILKKNLKEGKRGRLFSLSSAVGYGEGVLLSLAMGGMLDQDPGLWKLLFVGAALLGLVGSFVQASVPVQEGEREKRPSLKELIVRPWRDSIELMRTRKDFAGFQWGFMVCGFAVMLIQPALPLFAVDELGISYTQMAAAISIAKGLGYVASSPLWGRWIDQHPIHRLASGVFLTIALFPVMLAMAQWQIFWLYAAYFLYGVGQGGSHLVWNMSGPHFAGKDESARYTGVNVAMAGLRGAVGPPLGGWMSVVWGALPVLGIGAVLCLWSGLRILKFVPKKSLALNR
ncbi:MAG: transporter [Parachlamydiales bacterium]|nr:transporter [Parachlamydiales bacterium]